MKMKKVLSAVAALSIMLSLNCIGVSALFDDDGGSDTGSDTVVSELTMTGKVKRVVDKAMLVVPDDSSLGDEVAVTYASNGQFKVDDIIKVSYSQAPTTTNNTTTINADKVELVSSGATETPDTTTADTSSTPATAETTDTAATPVATAATTDSTPGTGNAEVTAFGVVAAAALAAVVVLNRKNENN